MEAEAKMKRRDRATRDFGYSTPKGLELLPFTVSLTIAALIMGVLGTAGMGCWPAPRAWTNPRKLTVFAAAPLSTTRTGPEKEKLVNRYAPPEYSKVTFSKVQSAQSMPSKGCVKPDTPICENFPRRGGTTGSPPALTPIMREGSCANVDVWFPWSIKEAQQAPTINDPNASVILDINPPLEDSGRDCAVWAFHYS